MISFLIYLAELSNSLHILCGFLGFVITIVSLACYFSVYHTDDDCYCGGDDHFDIKVSRKKLNYRVYYYRLCFGFVFMAIAAILPTEKTVYLMISSEYLSNTELPSKVIKVLNIKLDEMMEDKK